MPKLTLVLFRLEHYDFYCNTFPEEKFKCILRLSNESGAAGDGFVVFGTFSGTVFFSLVAFVVGSLVFLATVFVSSMIMSGSETASRKFPHLYSEVLKHESRIL